MRAPLNVLVLPYRLSPSGPRYAIFRRADGDGAVWQGVAGGAEIGEPPLAAAKRELWEETGLDAARHWIALDAHSCVPARVFRDWAQWGQEIYVVREICFGAEVASGESILLSSEHAAHDWLDYEAAHALLTFDSNRTALWELDVRLAKM